MSSEILIKENRIKSHGESVAFFVCYTILYMSSLQYTFSTGTGINYKFNKETFMSTDPYNAFDEMFDNAHKKYKSILVAEDLDVDECEEDLDFNDRDDN